MPQSASLDVYDGLTLPVDTVKGLPHRRLADGMGAAVRELQGLARFILTKNGVHAVVGVLVHKRSWDRREGYKCNANMSRWRHLHGA